MMKEEEHYEIRCDKCKHKAQHHAKSQFACIVEGCDCTSLEPIEVIKDESQEKP